MAPEDVGSQAGENQQVEFDPYVKVTDVERDKFDQVTAGYSGVPITRVIPDKFLMMDLYLPRLIRETNTLTMTRILRSGQVFQPKNLSLLKHRGFDKVYSPTDQMPLFLQYVNKNARKILNSPQVSLEAKAEVLYDNAFQIIEQAMTDPRLGTNVEMGRAYVEDMADFITRTPEAVKSLAEVLVIDYTLYTHSVNVCLLTVAFAHFLGLNQDEITLFGMGGLFHDVGKHSIPDAVLKKRGRLDEQEWALMRRHPAEGFQMLRSDSNMSAQALKMVYQHHENLDGTGYPRGLKREQIATQSRILRIIDAYDAITSTRCYKNASSAFLGVKIMYDEMKGQISDSLFQSFVTFLGSIKNGYGRRRPVDVHGKRLA